MAVERKACSSAPCRADPLSSSEVNLASSFPLKSTDFRELVAVSLFVEQVEIDDKFHAMHAGSGRRWLNETEGKWLVAANFGQHRSAIDCQVHMDQSYNS